MEQVHKNVLFSQRIEKSHQMDDVEIQFVLSDFVGHLHLQLTVNKDG